MENHSIRKRFFQNDALGAKLTEILSAKNLYNQSKFFQRIEEPNGCSPTDLIRWVFLSAGNYFLRAHRFEA
jgi:hypothetical protein